MLFFMHFVFNQTKQNLGYNIKSIQLHTHYFCFELHYDFGERGQLAKAQKVKLSEFRSEFRRGSLAIILWQYTINTWYRTDRDLNQFFISYLLEIYRNLV